jgi:signal transduction histidine kinase
MSLRTAAAASQTIPRMASPKLVPLANLPPYRHVHPLEVIPAFRRIAPSISRDLFYTFILCAVITLTFSLIVKMNVKTQPFADLVYVNGVYALCIGYTQSVLAMLTRRMVTRWFDDGRTRNYTIAGVSSALVGGVIGYIVAAELLGVGFQLWSGTVVGVLWVTALILGMVVAQRRRILSELAFEREHSARVEAERLTIASRLQMLQAQIEPHFLFNTLANVSSLIESEPKQARKMLDELTLLLRSALDSTRRPTISLSKELQVLEAYLAVLKVRMEKRLTYSVDAPADLLPIQVPAMLLQPIVENAVKHGIEPRMEGGEVKVEVVRDGDSLQFTVLDNGVGFAPDARENIGMGAVRERLAVQYGAAAELRVERTAEHWTRITIRIPMPT